MDPHDNPREKLHHTPEDKLSRPRLRGQLLLPDGLHAGSLQIDSSPSRFGGMRLGIEESVVGLLIYFPLLALLRWVFGRRGHSVSAPLGDKAIKSPGDYVAVKYAATTTIRQDLRTATGSRANRREEAMVLGSSSDPGVGHDVEAGASAPCFPRPRPLLPPLSIDEVLQKSVWGFREKWWPTSSTAAFEAARIEEAEGNVGDIGGLDMHPETKAFLDKYVYSHPLCIISSTSRTCPAVEEKTCYLPSTSAADAVYPLPSSTSTSSPSISSACPAVNQHACFVPLPSVANAAGASFSSAAEETTGRARADTAENDVAGSILAGSGLAPAVVSSTPVVVGPKLFETLSIGQGEPEIISSRVESSRTFSQRLAGKEAISLNLPDGVTGGELETSESGYDGDDDDDGDENDSRPGSLSIGGVMLDSREQQQHDEKMEEIDEEEQEEKDIKTTSLADGAIEVKLRTIGSDDDDDGNGIRYLGSNRFAVLFESGDEEEDEQEDDMEGIRLADREMEEKLVPIGSDDGNDDNDAIDAPHASNNRFAVLFESSEEEEEEEGERQKGYEEWGDTWGEESDEEEEEEVEGEEAKEEMEARQMEMEDDEAQEMQENWREIDDEWEALEEWVEEEEKEEGEGEEESVGN